DQVATAEPRIAPQAELSGCPFQLVAADRQVWAGVEAERGRFPRGRRPLARARAGRSHRNIGRSDDGARVRIAAAEEVLEQLEDRSEERRVGKGVARW